MAATLFDAAAEGLERNTDFDRLEARGTLRFALKESGLEPEKLTFAQLEVVFEKVMPLHLEKRAVSDAAAVCEVVIIGLSASDHATQGGVSSDEIFGRLGGD